MLHFVDFLRTQSIKNILYMFTSGFLNNRKALQEALYCLLEKIVFGSIQLNDWESKIYKQMLQSVHGDTNSQDQVNVCINPQSSEPLKTNPSLNESVVNNPQPIPTGLNAACVIDNDKTTETEAGWYCEQLDLVLGSLKPSVPAKSKETVSKDIENDHQSSSCGLNKTHISVNNDCDGSDDSSDDLNLTQIAFELFGKKNKSNPIKSSTGLNKIGVQNGCEEQEAGEQININLSQFVAETFDNNFANSKSQQGSLKPSVPTKSKPNISETATMEMYRNPQPSTSGLKKKCVQTRRSSSSSSSYDDDDESDDGDLKRCKNTCTPQPLNSRFNKRRIHPDSSDDESEAVNLTQLVLETYEKNFISTEHVLESADDEEEEDMDLSQFVTDTFINNFHNTQPHHHNHMNNTGRDQVGHGATRLEYLLLQGEEDVFIKKFALKGRRIRFTFQNVPTQHNPLTWLKRAMQELLDYVLRGYEANDFVGIVLENEEFVEKPLYMSFRKVCECTVDVLMALIASVLQSNRTFFTNNKLKVKVDCVHPPTGAGNSVVDGKPVGFTEFSVSKNSIFVIENRDKMCLALALVVAKYFNENNYDKKSLKVFKTENGRQLMTNMAVQLCHEAGVNLMNGGGYEHIDRFQQYFEQRYTIVVYNDRSGESVYYEGVRAPGKPCLNLLFEENHYNVILSLTGAFSAIYFCELCRKRYRTKDRHTKCVYTCPCCHGSPPCDIKVPEIKCRECSRSFRGRHCLEIHTRTKLCQKVKKCDKCSTTIHLNRKQKHVCGVSYCVTCGDYKPIRHFCFMTPNKSKKFTGSNDDEKNVTADMFLFLFYDFETMQDTQIDVNTYLHVPNLCISQQVCAECISNENINEVCPSCGIREHVFKDKPVDNLMNHIADLSKKFQITAIAHNMKAFDGCFVMQHVFNNTSRWKPSIIKAGTKIMSIKCGSSIRFIDSLNFIQLPLAQFPKCFNIDACKGYFPHYFNTRQNQNYIGRIPDKEHYGCNAMKEQVRVGFLKWYEEAENQVFDMQYEIVKYCRSDVEVLRKSCMKFRRCFIETNNVDPFRESVTIASACNLVFRRNFLKPNSIGILPKGGYRLKDRQSAIAHAGNANEIRLKEGLLVDGFCRETNTVYEFHGCWWHGCEICFFDQTAKLANKNDFMYIRRENTKYKDEKIVNAGYTLKTMRECEFERLIKTEPRVKDFVENANSPKQTPLNPRDSFFGGRTNACRLYHKCEEGEKIMYFDVCSLYPYINKYGKYPTGHPKNIYVGHSECSKVNLYTVEGLVKCTVLPPDNLYHPVLPYRNGGKLTFPLCRTCVEVGCQSECTHDVTERQFIGTYVADELRKALELNYRVTELFEIWEYDVVTYDRVTKQGGLFSGYVNAFLKLKQEASGWPTWCTNDLEKENYLKQYAEREGVVLDKDKIAKNPGSRFLSKIMLNSFWGKFGQRENLEQTELIHEPVDLFKLLTNPASIVNDLIVINPELLLVSWERPEEGVDPLKTVNVVIASYTTANARLELYKYLEVLGRRVLYYDTDSVIFTQKEGEYSPPTGDFLGDLTDEMLEYGEGSYITEFVSGGPKNYGYKIPGITPKKNSEPYVR